MAAIHEGLHVWVLLMMFVWKMYSPKTQHGTPKRIRLKRVDHIQNLHGCMFGHCYQAEVDSLETEVKKLMLSSAVQSRGVWMHLWRHHVVFRMTREFGIRCCSNFFTKLWNQRIYDIYLTKLPGSGLIGVLSSFFNDMFSSNHFGNLDLSFLRWFGESWGLFKPLQVTDPNQRGLNSCVAIGWWWSYPYTYIYIYMICIYIYIQVKNLRTVVH